MQDAGPIRAQSLVVTPGARDHLLATEGSLAVVPWTLEQIGRAGFHRAGRRTYTARQGGALPVPPCVCAAYLFFPWRRWGPAGWQVGIRQSTMDVGSVVWCVVWCGALYHIAMFTSRLPKLGRDEAQDGGLYVA